MTQEERYKWNWEIINYHVDFDEVDIEVFSEHHVRITRCKDKKKLDFWPNTNRAMWMDPNVRNRKSFFIPDFDDYLYKNFINYGRTNT